MALKKTTSLVKNLVKKAKEKTDRSASSKKNSAFKQHKSNNKNVNLDGNTVQQVKNIETLDAFFRVTQYIGSRQQALTNNLYGINHRAVKGMLPENRDSYGLTFFTRPMLNLSTPNLRNERKFYSLLTTNEKSMHRYVRNMLDPRLKHLVSITPDFKDTYFPKAQETRADYNIKKFGASQSDMQGYERQTDVEKVKQEFDVDTIKAFQKLIEGEGGITCPMVDEKLGFIPILTNNLKSLDGWPDYAMASFTSKAGLKGEQWGIADNHIELYGEYDLSATFRNIKDEPLVLMFETWLRYMANVFEGMLSPYMDFIIENEIDYNTRIYRLILDESNTFVKKISACGAAWPQNVPNGKFFSFNDTDKYNMDNKDINISFKCYGAMYNDDILVHEFNQVTAIFNKELRDFINGQGKLPNNYVKIPHNLLPMLNHRGYPLINKDTLELEWYINTGLPSYKEIMKYYK